MGRMAVLVGCLVALSGCVAVEETGMDEAAGAEGQAFVVGGQMQAVPAQADARQWPRRGGGVVVSVAAVVACGGPGDCDDGNPCTLDYCQASGACYNPEDTQHLTCGDGGHCWQGACCEGGYDLDAQECVDECPAGTEVGYLGACQ